MQQTKMRFFCKTSHPVVCKIPMHKSLMCETSMTRASHNLRFRAIIAHFKKWAI